MMGGNLIQITKIENYLLEKPNQKRIKILSLITMNKKPTFLLMIIHQVILWGRQNLHDIHQLQLLSQSTKRIN